MTISSGLIVLGLSLCFFSEAVTFGLAGPLSFSVFLLFCWQPSKNKNNRLNIKQVNVCFIYMIILFFKLR